MARVPGDVRRLNVFPTVVALAVLLLACLVASALKGDYPLTPLQVIQAALHPILPFVPAPADETAQSVVNDIRLPRTLLAALVGASLSLSGCALQGVIGNPLADPYTIGVSSGAAVGAGLALLLGWAGLWHGLALSACAFGTALAALLFVFALARIGGRLHTASFLLAGIVAGSFLWAVMTLLLSLAGTEQQRILAWLMGRFDEATRTQVGLLFPVTLLSGAVFFGCGRGLDAFAFGEDVARSVGVEVERFKAGVLGLCALLTAAAVSVSGIIGFVGLVVPHLSRALVGPPHRATLPVSALLGALLTVLADLLARSIRPGEELPVGVVTALLGAPFFLVLLRKQLS